MTETRVPDWLKWAREIQSMCQTGLAYSQSDYETRRYERLMEIAAEMVEAHTDLPVGILMENFSAQPGYATVPVGHAGWMGRCRGSPFRDGGAGGVGRKRLCRGS